MMAEFLKLIGQRVDAALWDCCPPDFIYKIKASQTHSEIIKVIAEDAIAFSNKDPASGNDPAKIILAYTSFNAILHYRVANSIMRVKEVSDDAEVYASILSSRGKLLSGAEIHYKSRIGRRFILDHGIGTVIGETSEIGNDCYILGGVTLGASGIAGNPSSKRHPTIGNRVQIGAYSRVFGDIKIGDDVFIGPNCVVIENIPPKTKVTLKTSLQISKINCFADIAEERSL